MGEVIPIREEMGYTVRDVCIQVSRYPQDDGTGLYAVEILYPDGTWKGLHHSTDVGRAWKLAGREAGDRRVTLLPDSIWPNRSSLP